MDSRSSNPCQHFLLPMVTSDGLNVGQGVDDSASLTPSTRDAGLARALREQGANGSNALHELALWVAGHRESRTPPERMVSELKLLLSHAVTPAFPPADAPELQRAVVQSAIGLFYAEE